MKLKQLEGVLQQVDDFDSPKVVLEQYATSAHIAAHMVNAIDQTFDDVKNKVVFDLGCGCGMLSIGCSVANAALVLGMDIDDGALNTARLNLEAFGMLSCVELLQCDVVNDKMLVDYLSKREMVDTVIMNPPFGTKNNKGIDIQFLHAAINVSQGAVYSLHKTSTREYVLKKAREWGSTAEVCAELTFDLPKTYAFHRKQTADVMVDFIRCEKIR